MKLSTVATFAMALLLAFSVVEKLREHRADRLLQSYATGQVFADSPVQTATSDPPFMLHGYRIRPLAAFALRARVLSRENYYFDRGAGLSRVDLAVGWKRMADPAVYESMHITQGWRWLYFEWNDLPLIPEQEIIESSANMHMIAANPMIERALQKIRKGVYVRITGKLVEVTSRNGWRWSSSLSRTDTGAHACEVVFAESVQVEN
ncbi:hypothetical protein [Verminephrobacter eiseniae]|uniref:hypothetical protein n=1 Tax=Verminephrobacter eiseniae TaxID=364317 RepID=UPI0022389973|nr:hypothetical protein [Verminephrobacter eiseniae]MCW5237852.1 hypothetical protein [Verminephrobacter eiseniae]